METSETPATVLGGVEAGREGTATLRRSLRRGAPALIAVLAVAAALASPGAIGPHFGLVGLASPCDLGSDPTAPICIGSLSASVQKGGDTVSVQLGAVNDRGTIRVGKACWLLSRPGQKPNWRHDEYHSVEQDLVLAGREHQTLRWTEHAPIPDGFYEFSAWIHVKTSTGEFVHSYSNTIASLYINSSPG